MRKFSARWWVTPDFSAWRYQDFIGEWAANREGPSKGFIMRYRRDRGLTLEFTEGN